MKVLAGMLFVGLLGVSCPTAEAEDADVSVWYDFQIQGSLAGLSGVANLNPDALGPERVVPVLIRGLLTGASNPEKVAHHGEGSFGPKIALWLDQTLLPVVASPSASGEPVPAELSLLGSAAGMHAFADSDSDEPRGPVIEWEGFRYRVDPAPGLFDRMRKIRVRQAGNTVDVLLKLARARAALDAQPTLADISRQLDVVRQLQMEVRQFQRPTALTSTKPPGVTEILRDAARDLAKIKDLKHLTDARRVGRSLDALCADVAADVLRSLVYAMHIVNPDGALLAGGDVSFRHDLGLAAQSLADRERSAWGVPSESQAGAWHVKGSLLDLDMALASVALRGVLSPKPPEAPLWNKTDQDSFGQTLSLFNPSAATAESRLNWAWGWKTSGFRMDSAGERR